MTISGAEVMCLLLTAAFIWSIFQSMKIEAELDKARHELSGVEAERDILRNRVDQLIRLRDEIYDLAADDCGYVDSDDGEDDE